MDILLAIQIAKELARLAPQGVDLAQHVADLLKASNEPEAKTALAKLQAAYEESSIAADQALAKRIAEG